MNVLKDYAKYFEQKEMMKYKLIEIEIKLNKIIFASSIIILICETFIK